MLKQKVTGTVQEVILPDFPDDDNTVTTTVTKSRRVSFGPNFVKEFIVDSAITGQCMPEYEQPFPSSDSSSADSSLSAVGQSTYVVHENVKVHKSESVEERPKPPKFGSTICFSADSPTADMEFTEGCITLAKSILDKKNKEMTVFIQAKSKEGEKMKEDDTNYFEGSQFEMSVTKCLKSKENSRQQEKRFVGEKTRVFGKYDDEMSMTMCEKLFVNEESDDGWEEGKENRMPLDAIMRHLDKDSSDSDLFNPERSFGKMSGANPFELSVESENLNLNESMDISGEAVGANSSEKSTNEMNNFQPSFDKSDALLSEDLEVKGNTSEVAVNPPSFIQEIVKDMTMEEAMDISADIQSGKAAGFGEDIQSEKTVDIRMEIRIEKEMDISVDIQSGKAADFSKHIQSEKTVDTEMEILAEKEIEFSMDSQTGKAADIHFSKDKQSEKAEDIGVEIRIQKDMGIDAGIQSKKVADIHYSKDKPSEKAVEIPTESEVDIDAGIQSKKAADIHLSKDKQSEKAVDIGVEIPTEAEMDIDADIQSKKVADINFSKDKQSEKTLDIGLEILAEKEMDIDADIQSGKAEDFSKHIQSEKTVDTEVEIPTEKGTNIGTDIQSEKAEDILSEKTVDIGVDIGACIQSEKAVTTEITSSDVMDGSAIAFRSVTSENLTEKRNKGEQRSEEISVNESEPSEASCEKSPLADLKVVESLTEQSKEPGCVWSLKELRHPGRKTEGSLSFSCRLLESTTSLNFALKMSEKDDLDSFSIVTGSTIQLDEEKQWRLPEYTLAVGFGFNQLKKHFEERRQHVETIRHVPYFLDEVNAFLSKTNAYLQQVYSILSSYPGSRLKGSVLSFRLFSFPIFFSCTVSISLGNMFRLSRASLSFEHDFGCLDEKKVGKIFEECLKRENSLCEFVVQSTRYLVELERPSGYVSKRGHIRLLPEELRS